MILAAPGETLEADEATQRSDADGVAAPGPFNGTVRDRPVVERRQTAAHDVDHAVATVYTQVVSAGHVVSGQDFAIAEAGGVYSIEEAKDRLVDVRTIGNKQMGAATTPARSGARISPVATVVGMEGVVEIEGLIAELLTELEPLGYRKRSCDPRPLGLVAGSEKRLFRWVPIDTMLRLLAGMASGLGGTQVGQEDELDAVGEEVPQLLRFAGGDLTVSKRDE